MMANLTRLTASSRVGVGDRALNIGTICASDRLHIQIYGATDHMEAEIVLSPYDVVFVMHALVRFLERNLQRPKEDN